MKIIVIHNGADEGSELIIKENINYDTSLFAYKGPHKLEMGKIRLLKTVHKVRIQSVKPIVIVKQS